MLAAPASAALRGAAADARGGGRRDARRDGRHGAADRARLRLGLRWPGSVANVVALPVVAPIMWVGMLQCALAQVPGAARGREGSGAARVGSTALLLGAAALAGARRSPTRRGRASCCRSRSRRGGRGCYALIAALVAGGPARSAPGASRERARAPRPRGGGSRRRRAVARGARRRALRPRLERTRPSRPAPPAQLTVSFLDVGQGDATLIQDGAGASVLFDGGPPEARVYRQVRAAGVSAARPGGVDAPVARPPGRSARGARADPDRGSCSRTATGPRSGLPAADRGGGRARGAGTSPARAGQVLRVGRLTIQILGPAAARAGRAAAGRTRTRSASPRSSARAHSTCGCRPTRSRTRSCSTRCGRSRR